MKIDSPRTSPEPIDDTVPPMPEIIPPNQGFQELFNEDCYMASCVEEGEEESCWARVCATIACIVCSICRLIDSIVIYFCGEEAFEDSANELLLQKQPSPTSQKIFFNPFILPQYQKEIEGSLKETEENLNLPCQIEAFVRVYPDCQSPMRYTFKMSKTYGENEKKRLTSDFHNHLEEIAGKLRENNIALDFKTKIGILFFTKQQITRGVFNCFALDQSMTGLSSGGGSSGKKGCSKQECLNLKAHHLKLLDQPSQLSQQDLAQLEELEIRFISEPSQAARS